MNFSYFLLLFSILNFSLSISYAQSGKQLKKGIEQAMAHEMDMDTAKITGFVIGIFDHDSSWVFPYGRVSKTEKTLVDATTRFEMGAASHPFLLSQLRQLTVEKRIDLDKNVNFYLKLEQKFPLGDKITLRQLANHTSSLPKYPPNFGDFETDPTQPFADYTEGVFWRDLKDLDTTRAGVGKYFFSHVGMAILEKIIAPFTPSQTLFLEDKNLAQGYNLAQKPVGIWQFGEMFQRVLGLKMSANEVLSFIKKESQDLTITDVWVPTELNEQTFMGNTWHIIQQNKQLWVSVATGMTAGHSVFIGFVPQTQTGVVILTNSRIIQGKLGFQVLRMLNKNWHRKQ